MVDQGGGLTLQCCRGSQGAGSASRGVVRGFGG